MKKVVIVQDWLTENGGAEKVLSSLLEIYPEADIYSLVDFLDVQDRQAILKGKNSTNSFIQKLPFAKKHFRNYLPLFPIAIEQLDLSAYDLVISSSYAVAKGIMTNPHQTHICYCHSPIRYAWDMYHTYIKEHNIRGLKGLLIKYVLYKIRMWDVSSANRVDHFITNSNLVKKRVEKFYRREAQTIYPPVNVEKFTFYSQKEEYYLTVSRLVPYKKIKLIVETFNKIGKKLVIIGTGPELKEIKAMAESNIEILGYQSDEVVIHYMQRAKAFVYAALEDFGIVPVEAMSCGTPVICYGKGGLSESVIDGKCGVYFKEQSVEAIEDAVGRFEKVYTDFDLRVISEHAESFSKERFKSEIEAFIEKKIG